MSAFIPNFSLSTLMSVVHLLEMHSASHRAEKVRTFQAPIDHGYIQPVVYGPGDEEDSMHFASATGHVAALLFDVERNIFRVYLGKINNLPGSSALMFMGLNFTLSILEERKPLVYEFSVEQVTQVAEVIFQHIALYDTQVLYRENVVSGLPVDTFTPIGNNHGHREAEFQLEQGTEHPYAGQAPQDLAERIVNGVLYNLGDRRGIREELDNVDRETRQEIVSGLAKIVRVGLKAERSE
jgi:hypothetical protein